MLGTQKFFRCRHCGNLAGMIKHSGAPMTCCGEKMAELVPNTVEASTEKHLPAVTVVGGSVSVQVGSVPHPMTEEHNISFVYLETENGGQLKRLNAGDSPNVEFSLADDKPLTVYAYCNLHGLWAADV